MTQIESPDFASPEFKANPYAFYARLRAEAPTYRTRLTFWLPVWLVTRYDDVLTVLKDHRFTNDYSARLPWIPRFVRPFYRNLLTIDDPDHARLRTHRWVGRCRQRAACRGWRVVQTSFCDVCDLLTMRASAATILSDRFSGLNRRHAEKRMSAPPTELEIYPIRPKAGRA